MYGSRPTVAGGDRRERPPDAPWLSGIGILDCFVADGDPRLRRVRPDPVASQVVWAETHRAMARAPRAQAVIAFLRRIFAEHRDMLEGSAARLPGLASDA